MRHREKRTVGLAVIGVLLASTAALGQGVPQPRLLYVMPPGGQAGSSFDVVVTGQDFRDVHGLHFSFAGAKVDTLGSETSPKIDPKAMKLQGKPPPGIASQKFKVTLPPDAPLGIQDIRVVSKGGVSNPRAFVVGTVKEFVEKEPNSDVPDANRVELNSTVSGVISNPTDVDYFVFTGKKGQRVILGCLATSIDSKLPAVVDLYSAGGNYLGGNKAYQGNDALLDATLPDDGDYYARVHSYTYTLAGPDYAYRLTISTAPWIDAVFPSVLEPGKETQVSVYGRNLPGGKPDPDTKIAGQVLDRATMSIKAPAGPQATRLTYAGFVAPSGGFLDGFEFRVRNQAGASNAVLLTLADAPVVKDSTPNDRLESAQPVPVPCVIAGHFEKKSDRDWFLFKATKGQVLTIEAYGDRLGAPLDLVLRVTDAAGKNITEQDENPEIMSPQFFTRTDDPPRFRFVPPADGEYAVLVMSKFGFTEAGPRYLYQLRIAAERPDFRIVAMPPSPLSPDSVSVGQGGHQALTLFVDRRDGFNGEIALSAGKLPAGVSMRPQSIPAGAKQGAVVLGAAADAPHSTEGIQLFASATINGQKVVREIRAASITWPVIQPNTPTITRMDREIVLAVRDKPPFTLAANLDKITVKQGERISIPVKLTRQADFKATVNVAALALPPGYGMQAVTFTPGKDTITVNLDAKPNAPPGIFTLILRGSTGPVGPKPQPPLKPGVTFLTEPAPPVTLVIVPKQIIKLKVPAGIAKLQPGSQVDLPVEIARLFDHQGVFKVELVVPANVKGLRAADTQIKPGENAARLMVRADADAKPGQFAGLSVRVTAMFGDTPIVHESKLTVTVTK